MTQQVYIPLEGGTIDLSAHALRDVALDEIHARPFYRHDTPRRLLHFAFQVNGEEAARDRDAVRAMCERHMFALPAKDSAYHRIIRPHFGLRWEQHSEFTTQTWDFPLPKPLNTRPEGPTLLPASDFLATRCIACGA